MLSFSWRYVYLATFALRFFLALSDAYIHPDEHFQSFEVMTHRVLGYHTSPPWEFDPALPARSLAPLYLVYYVPLKIFSWLGLAPLQIWYSMRLLFMLLSWVVTDWCLYRMLPSKQERIKAVFFVSTSFVSLVYQNHTFSNSVETLLVVATTWMLNELRFFRSTESEKIKYSTQEVATKAALIGGCFALGVFNRITFPAFFVFPSVFYLECSWRWRYIPFVSLLSFAAVASLCVVTDTVCFRQKSMLELWQSPFSWSQYVVAPLNSLVYNTTYSNLALHGIHPFYTHVLINLPQLMGPGLVFLLPNWRNSYWKTTPFLSAVSGLLFLSLVPHQELRFLVPVVPLLCSCFDVAALKTFSKSWLPSLLMFSWLAFNLLMCLIMGVFHQGGVVPALSEIHDSCLGSSKLYIWWRTYTPPTWMVGDIEDTQMISLGETAYVSVDPNANLVILDARGAEISTIKELVSSCKKNISELYIVTPIASFHLLETARFDLKWSTAFHLDLDHLDFSDTRSLKPGLAIYQLL